MPLATLTYVDKDHNTIDEWREKFNLISQNVLDLSLVSGVTEDLLSRGPLGEIPGSIVDSYSHSIEKDDENELKVTSSTTISNFDYEVFADIVAFVNDTKKDFKDITDELINLTTEERSSLSAAINWCVTELGASNFTETNFVGMLNDISYVVGDVGVIESDLPQILLILNLMVSRLGSGGNLLNLTTPVKTDLILSINSLMELIEIGFANRDAVRISFDGFDDDESLTLVDKLNKAVAVAGNRLRLQTINKNTHTDSLNEIHDEIGSPSDLTTLLSEDIVSGINEKHHWKVMANNIAYADDVHILTTGTVLTIEEEYDFYVKEGHREQYDVWVRSGEKRNYKVWTSSGYRKNWTVKVPSGYYRNVLKVFPSGHWTQTKVANGFYHLQENFFSYAGFVGRRIGRLWHNPVRRRVCIKNSALPKFRNNWWTIHRRNGWTGPVGLGGIGTGIHDGHILTTTPTGVACSWDIKRKWVNTSTTKSTRVWVNTTKTVNKSKWVDTSHWVKKVKNVDTSHYEKRTRWIDTSHYVKRTRQIPQPDLPEIGLYLDGQVKSSAGFLAGNSSNKFALYGDVIGNVQGRVTGDASGTVGNWSENRQMNLTGAIDGTFLIDGGANKSLNIQNQLKFSQFIHDHDTSSNYWLIGDDKDLYVVTFVASMTHTQAWDAMVVQTTQTVVDTWGIGSLVVIHAGSNHYLWLKSTIGWFYVAGNTYSIATV